jgi:exopolysaccharide biosynthesis polyprenyl glycosylphosphotransferase
MLRRFSIDFAIFMMLVDSLLVAAGLALAVWVRPELGTWTSLAVEYPGPYILSGWLYPIFSVTWVSVFILFSAYDMRKNFRVVDEMTVVFLGSSLAVVAIAGMLYLTFRDFSRALFVTFVLSTFILLILVRLLYRYIFKLQAEKGVSNRQVLIIGAGVVGKKVAAHIKEYANFGLKFAGYLDDDPQKKNREDVLGTLIDVRKVVHQWAIDDVIMALPQRAHHRSEFLAKDLHDLPIRVWVVPDYFSLALNQAIVEDMAGIPMIDLRAPALNDYQRMVKRAFDLLVSILFMPFIAPLLGVIALAIRLDTPGPVFFHQARVGENGKVFKMIKFRTMVQDAEKMRHVIEKIDSNGKIIQNKKAPDPRVTRVGAILRKTSLDEFPQLINVLAGEMSLVGPRPEMPHLVTQYEPWQRARFTVPQGMTGWWQVNGRSDRPMNENTEDDLYYVKNYSIWLDLLILMKTVWVVFRRKGAY